MGADTDKAVRGKLYVDALVPITFGTQRPPWAKISNSSVLRLLSRFALG